MTTYGPGGDFLIVFTWPSLYWSLATPGGMEVERIRDTMLSRAQGGASPSTDEVRGAFLMDAETRAASSGLAQPTADWWMDYCTAADFDSDTALMLFILDTSDVPSAGSTVMVAQISELSAGLRGMPADFTCELAQRRRQRAGYASQGCRPAETAPIVPRVNWPTPVPPRIDWLTPMPQRIHFP